MIVIENLENNIKKMEKYVDVRKDKLGEVLKFFYDDMLALEMSNFAKTEQVRIFEKAFDRDIIYITYVSIFNRLTKDISTTKMFNNNAELGNKNKVLNTDNLPSKINIKNVPNSQKKIAVKSCPENGNDFMKKLVNQGNKNIKIKKEI